MTRHDKITASSPLSTGTTAGALIVPANQGVPATLSLTSLLANAAKYERATNNEAELEYLCNIAAELMKARPGVYAEECLQDFKASLEAALENEAEDRRWNEENAR